MSSIQPKVSYITVHEEYAGQRLDNFLLRELKGAPRSLIYRIVRRGEVRVNDGRAKAHARVQAGDRIRIPPLRLSRKPPASTPKDPVGPGFDILYEDAHILVINKPAGVAVHGGSGVASGVIEQLRARRTQDRYLDLVHRLDRDTSGCLLLAKKRAALRALHEDLRQTAEGRKRIKKQYLALVQGHWQVENHVVAVPLKKNAQLSGERMVLPAQDGVYANSRFTTVRSFPGCTLVRIDLITGRTHQARVHAAAQGHPIIGDEKYGHNQINRLYRSMGLKRLFLHANKLAFIHPATAQKIEVSCPLPKDLQILLEKIGPGRSEPSTP